MNHAVVQMLNPP